MNTPANDKVFRSRTEELLGLRGQKANHAVRFGDIEAVLRNSSALTGGTVDPDIIKPIVDKVVDDALDGYTPPGWDPIIERIEQAEQDAEQAKQDVLNAIAQADAAHAYVDEQVGLLYADLDALKVEGGLIDQRVQDARDDLMDSAGKLKLDLLTNATDFTTSEITAYDTVVQGRFTSLVGQVEQLTAALTSANLVGNGLFALGATGWTLSAGATVLVRDEQTGLAADAPQPNMVQLAAANAESIQTSLNSFEVGPNDRVQVRFSAAASAARTIDVTLVWLDSAGSPIGAPAVETLAVSPAGSWKVYGKQIDPPDTAVGATLTIAKAAGGAAVFLTAIECSTVNIALEARVTQIEGAYVDEAEVTALISQQVDGRFLDADAAVVDEAIIQVIEDSAIADRITVVETAVGPNGSIIENHSTAIATNEEAIAQVDERVTATYGKTQLVRDPGFRRNLDFWPGTMGVLADLQVRDTASATAALKTMPDAKAFRIAPGATGARQTEPFDVAPAERYALGFFYFRASATAPKPIAFIQWLTAAGAVLSNSPLLTAEAVGAWNYAAMSDLAPHASAAKARVVFQHGSFAATAGNAWVTSLTATRLAPFEAVSQAEITELKQAWTDPEGAFASFVSEVRSAINDEDTGLGALAEAIEGRYTKAETDEAISAVELDLNATLAKETGGVLSDPYLESSDWLRWSGDGTLVFRPNEKFDIGRTWDFTVTATQQDGMRIAASPETIWPGQTDAGGYVVEIDYTLVSGSLNGATVLVEWTNGTGTNYRAQKTLASMTPGTGLPGRSRLARGVFVKPAGFTGAFASHNLFVLVNHLPPLAAKRIKIHRVRVRVATDEEMGSGQVMAEVQAHLTQNFFTKAQTNQAIANFDMDLYAELGGAWAQVKQSATALATLDGTVARFRNIVQTDDGKVAAGIEAVAFDNIGGATGSLLKLIGDNVVAKGTLSTNALVVGLGGNLLQDPSFDDGFAHWVGTGTIPAAQRTIGTRGPGVSYSHPGWPTLMIHQSSGYADGTRQGQIFHRPINSEAGARAVGVPVTAGKTYIASAYFRTLRCEGHLYIFWYDAEGNQIGPAEWTARKSYPTGAQNRPDAWERVHLKSVAPTLAAFASISFVKRDTDSGEADSYLFIWKPQLEETHAEATVPTPWSPGGTTYINGGRLFAKSILTRHLDTNDLEVAGLSIFNGELRSADFNAANFTGWRITKGGPGQPSTLQLPRAIIKTAHIDTLQIQRGHVQDESITSYPYSLTQGSISIPADRTWVTIQTLILSKGRDSPLPIDFSFVAYFTESPFMTLRLLRNGEEMFLDRPELLFNNAFDGTAGEGGSYFKSFVDVFTSTGSVTYRMQVRLGSSGVYGDPALSISRRFLGALNAHK